MLALFRLGRLKADVWVFPHHQSSVDGRNQTPIVKSAFGRHSHSRSTPAGPGQALLFFAVGAGVHIFQCDKEVAHRETGCKRARKHCADFGWRRMGVTATAVAKSGHVFGVRLTEYAVVAVDRCQHTLQQRRAGHTDTGRGVVERFVQRPLRFAQLSSIKRSLGSVTANIVKGCGR